MPISFSWSNQPLVRRLINRFRLSDMPLIPDAMAVQPTIYPVTQLDELLKTTNFGSDTEDLTAAAGTHTPYFTVPVGKRWTLKWLHREATTGTSRVRLKRSTTFYNLIAPGTAANYQPCYDIKLDEGDEIGMNTTGNGADGAINCQILYEEEDRFEL